MLLHQVVEATYHGHHPGLVEIQDKIDYLKNNPETHQFQTYLRKSEAAPGGGSAFTEPNNEIIDVLTRQFGKPITSYLPHDEHNYGKAIFNIDDEFKLEFTYGDPPKWGDGYSIEHVSRVRDYNNSWNR